MATVFGDFDVSDFCELSEYAEREYTSTPPTDEVIAAVERQLDYKLPSSYVEFMRVQNGGIPRRTCHRMSRRTTWSHDHIAISGIYSIGGDRPSSLLGHFGSAFWSAEWGYPPIGIYFADCPSGGHDMLCLDYREWGPTGEPPVVHVDQEWDYTITPVAANFEAFVRGLVDQSTFDTVE